MPIFGYGFRFFNVMQYYMERMILMNI